MSQKIVVKRNGEFQPFDKKKVLNTAMKAGLNRSAAEKVANQIERNIPQRVLAKTLYARVVKVINSVSKSACCRYQLKEAIAKIDPELFEMYIQRVLERRGYETVWNRIIPGATVEHQVDVVAKKNDKEFLVEVKHHINPHRDTGLGKVLIVWARLLDIQEGYEKHKNDHANTEAWMINNTKFSWHARKFALGKGIRMSGWGTGQWALQKLIEDQRCYPTNILKLPQKTQTRCEQADLLTLCDINENEQKAREIFGSKYQETMKTIRYLMGDK